MKITSTMVLFYGSSEIYSNWYIANFTVDNITYNCNEQYMMHQKALLFNDLETAAKIMAAKHPRDQKALGKTVKNFNKAIWDAHDIEIVANGAFAKFSQHPKLEEEILNTGTRMLVEASSSDKIWGIGFSENDPRALNPANWTDQQNRLGQALMLVRDKLANRKQLEISYAP